MRGRFDFNTSEPVLKYTVFGLNRLWAKKKDRSNLKIRGIICDNDNFDSAYNVYILFRVYIINIVILTVEKYVCKRKTK